MKKIANYENIKENMGFQRLKPNGYIIKVLKVEDVADKEYLRVYFDVAEGEEKGYFKKQYDNDTRSEKKWANAGTFIRSYKETALPMFKGFTNALENSNKGYKWDFDEKKIVGKMLGVVIGEEEFINMNGKVRVRNYVSAIRSVDTIKSGDFTVPELKKVEETKSTTANKKEEFVNPFSDTTVEVANENPPFDTEDDDSNPFA